MSFLEDRRLRTTKKTAAPAMRAATIAAIEIPAFAPALRPPEADLATGAVVDSTGEESDDGVVV